MRAALLTPLLTIRSLDMFSVSVSSVWSLLSRRQSVERPPPGRRWSLDILTAAMGCFYLRHYVFHLAAKSHACAQRLIHQCHHSVSSWRFLLSHSIREAVGESSDPPSQKPDFSTDQVHPRGSCKQPTASNPDYWWRARQRNPGGNKKTNHTEKTVRCCQSKWWNF